MTQDVEEDDSLRDRLLDGVGDIRGQGKQLHDIKNVGLETNELLR